MTAPVAGVLLDIEGTTTPITFVHDVLFPFARARLASFVTAHAGTEPLGADLAALRAEHTADLAAVRTINPGTPVAGFKGHRAAPRGVRADSEPALASASAPPAWREDAPATPAAGALAAVPYLNWLMDQDRKSPALKSIQGRIWEQGYRDGTLKGAVFPDLVPALGAWRRAGASVRIFSSGSVLAQRLLFAHSEMGDLTQHLDGYFDTAIGPKTAAESYRRIAEAFALPPAGLMFVSDVAAELDAAREAGMQTRLCLRPGNRPQPAGAHALVQSLMEVPPASG